MLVAYGTGGGGVSRWYEETSTISGEATVLEKRLNMCKIVILWRNK